nr:AGAMOUS-like 24 [Prunus mume]
MVKMMREKIKIKKIDYLPARQVTFSKRRRGLFKKAAELSVLCESEVAVVIFSATDKLFHYSSSSTEDVIERYKAHTGGAEKSDKQFLELQLENENHIKLSKELEEKSRQLRQMKGEDLEGLNLDELLKLEQLVEASLGRVIETKEELIMSEIMALEKKGAELVETNNQLRHRMVMLSGGNTGPAFVEPETLITNVGGGGGEDDMSSESAVIATSTSCNSAFSLSLEDDCSDVTLSLKLGLP